MEKLSILALGVATLGSTLRLSTPLIYAALGGMFSERSGVMNIGLEGIMLMGAFTAVAVSYFTQNPWLGVVAAAIIGGIAALLHAWLSVDVKADQVISGTALNLLAVGVTSYLLIIIWDQSGHSPGVESIPALAIPLLSNIPVVGVLFKTQNLLVYIALALAPITNYILFKTPWGLRARAVGEHPRAADTVGISVRGIRYSCVIISGILAGIGGAYLSVAQTSGFVKAMSEGRGFIALGAMIFGRWQPGEILGVCLLFGFADALQWVLQAQEVNIPSQFLLALPYALTLFAMTAFVVKSIPPKAVGEPYP